MSINTNIELRNSFFALSGGAGAFNIMALTLLAGSSFALISSTSPMTAAFAQEENNTTTQTAATTPATSNI
jgi:hypothetical protein